MAKLPLPTLGLLCLSEEPDGLSHLSPSRQTPLLLLLFAGVLRAGADLCFYPAEGPAVQEGSRELRAF